MLYKQVENQIDYHLTFNHFIFQVKKIKAQKGYQLGQNKKKK